MFKFFSFILFLITPILLISVNTISLNTQQSSFLVIFSLVVWGWLFTKIPLFVTGILGVCASIFLSIIETKDALANFAHPIIYIFLGGYLFAEALKQRGIDKRIALNILTNPMINKSPSLIFLTLFLITAFFSMWISNTATTAMMLPIVIGILKNFKGLEDSHLESLILLGIAYAANIGGLGTPIGSTPNILAIGILKETAQLEVSFLKWVMIATPIMLLFLGILFLYIKKNMPTHIQNIDISELLEEKKKLHSFQREDYILIRLFAIMVLCWFLPSFITPLKKFLHPGIVALFFSSLLFVFPLKRAKLLLPESLNRIDWSSLLLFGAGLTLGKIFFSTGLAGLAGDFLIANLTGNNIILTITLLVFVSIFSTELTSNTATANILLPIVISMALTMKTSPLGIAMAVALSCSLAFMLPVATPPNVIVYGTGKIKLKDMVKLGFILNIVYGIALSFIFGLSSKFGLL